MKHCYLFIFLFCLAFSVIGQNTVGLLSYNPSKSFDGYNLIYPHNQPTVYLLDNCGEIVHTWTDDADFRPGNMAYLLPDGRLVKTKRPASVAGDPIWAGGGGAIVEIRDWDNNLEWSYTLNDSLFRLHHDIAVTEEGSIIAIVWELKTEAEAIAAGRDPAKISEGELWPDMILELDPVGDSILWEWHVWDHLIQDFDSTKANYGIVEDHPELIDINWDTENGDADWMHTNAIDYDDENKQIIISVPTFNEVWIIDHTTNTDEAAGHVGGNSNRGGDLMYRWGNPATYRAGDSTDQKLFYQHDIHWIDDFIDVFDPNHGKLGLFNNRVDTTFSTANIFNPGFDMYTWDYPFSNGVFDPAEFDLTLTHPTPTSMYSTGLSSFQYLPNSNYLICVGRFGYSFEMTPNNEIVWEYRTPLIGGVPATQGDTLNINNNLTFRTFRYPSDYEAFNGKDLSPKGWIEQSPDSTFCDGLVSIAERIQDYSLQITPNPATDMITVSWEGGVFVDLEVYDITGRPIVPMMQASGGRKYLDTSNWAPGIYIIRINQTESRKVIILN